MAIFEDEFGDIISKARVGNGLSAEHLAQSVNLCAADIDKIESYKLRPSEEITHSLAKTLALDPDKLIESLHETWSPAEVSLPSEPMLVERIPVKAAYTENAYILGCAETKVGAVIDPGGSAEEISSRLEQLGMRLEYIILTHAHRDHIAGIEPLLAYWKDVRLVNHQLERDSIMRGLSNSWEPAKDAVKINIGNLELYPIYTPGHTPGSVSYRVREVCFVGDTLFAGSIGRSTGTKAYKPMLEAIRCCVLSLPAETLILPGHGPMTTVAQELAHNPFF